MTPLRNGCIEKHGQIAELPLQVGDALPQGAYFAVILPTLLRIRQAAFRRQKVAFIDKTRGLVA
jgi:hypothetical protein